MQNLSSAMDAALLQDTTFLCRIWKLTLLNGSVFRFTDLTRDLTVGGELYKFDPGVKVSAVVKSSGGQPDNAQVEITTSAEFLSLNRLRQGAIKNAAFDMWIVDWRDPDTYGLISLFSGGTGTIKFNDKGSIDVGLNGDIGSGTQSVIGELYSRQCRARLGDTRCKFDLDAAGVAFTVASILDGGYSITATELAGQATDYFKFGKIVWATGLNANLSDEIKSNTTGTGKATLLIYPRNPIIIGDTGTIFPGCDFQVETCGNKFNNLNNFRGEPYVPPPTTYVFSGSTPYITSNYQPLGSA